MLAALPTTAGADVITVQRSYDTSTVEVENVTADDGNIYSKIKWGDLCGTGKPGAPDLPVEYVRILVPVYTNNFTVSVTRDGNDIYIPIEGRIYPGQQPRTTNATGPADFQAPDGEAYAADANMIRAEVVGDGFIDGCNHIVTVAVYPFNYNDDTMELTADTGLTLELEYDQCDVSEMTSTPIFPPYRSKYVDIESMVANPESEVIAESPEINPDAVEYYYIIAPRDLAPACEDLAVWKRQKGYKVVVKEVEEILNIPKYRIGNMIESVDSAASLRCFLRDEYKLNGAFFCLLVGDYRTSMPIRKMFCECKTTSGKIAKSTNPNTDYYVPTDTYFTDLTYNFPLSKNDDERIYSCSHDHLKNSGPSIYVGRLLCNTIKDIKQYTRKLILYEGNPGYGDNIYIDRAFSFCEDRITGLNDFLVRDHLEYFEEYLHLVNHPYYTIQGNHVIEQINRSGFSSLVGHGTPYSIECHYDSIIDKATYISSLDRYGRTDIGWKYEDALNNGLDNLTNYNKPGVAYSVSCTVAPFDSYTTDGGKIFNGPNIGEVYTTYGNYGGVAFCGNTRFGWCYHGGRIEAKWLNYVMNINSIGIAEAFGKREMLDGHSMASHNLIGDPEFKIWRISPWEAQIVTNIEDNMISFTDTIFQNHRLSIFDGNSSICYYNQNVKNRKYPIKGTHVFSVWENEYLPIIKFIGSNATIEQEKLTFIVRDAYFSMGVGKYTIGNNASLSVHALDSMKGYGGFEILNGGTAKLKCDQTASFENLKVRNGGRVIIEAEELTLDDEFEVELGGEFEFNPVIEKSK